MKLAYTGAVKEQILDVEELAAFLMELLWTYYPDAVKSRYGVEGEPGCKGWELLEAAGSVKSDDATVAAVRLRPELLEA